MRKYKCIFYSDGIIQDLVVPMLRQSLVCVAVENEQRCVTGVIISLQQPVFTVSLRSIDNPLVGLDYFHNVANIKKTMCHSRFASGGLCQSKNY